MPLMNWVEHEKEYRLGEHKLPYHFESNGHDGWIVDFINQLFQNVFDISLAMLENKNVREFPIAYSEEQTYSTIANAIGRLTPYHGSERYIGKGKNNEKRRYVDFWCRCIDAQGKIRDIWLECKNLWFNIGQTAKLEKTTKYRGIIQEAIEQIKTIEEKDSFKIAFFSVYLYYHVDNKHQQLYNMRTKVYERIRQEITNNNKGYIVYSILDLSKTIKDDNINEVWSGINKNKEKILEGIKEENPYQIFLEPSIYQNDKKEQFMPYMMLVAVIEECSKNNSSKS